MEIIESKNQSNQDQVKEIDKEQKTPTFIGMAITISRIREHFGVES